jgi:hypothetical protein
VNHQQLQPWRTGKGQTLWLRRLVDSMEKFSTPEWRARRADRRELAAVSARLARPARAYPAPVSSFSLRN